MSATLLRLHQTALIKKIKRPLQRGRTYTIKYNSAALVPNKYINPVNSGEGYEVDFA